VDTAGSRRARLAFAAVGIAAAVLQVSSSVLGDLARLDHGTLVGASADVVRLGADHAGLFRWAGLLDMLGSDLLLLPLAVYLWSRFRDAHPTAVDVGTVAAVVGLGVGAAGAAAWSSAAPLITAYASASPTDRPHVALTFVTVIHVAVALWHYVTGPALAMWLVSVAIAVRDEWRGFAIYSAILAAVTAVGSIGTALVPNATSSGPSTLFFLPLAVWSAWLAVRIWRDDASIS
jgi:hypothetical protein